MEGEENFKTTGAPQSITKPHLTIAASSEVERVGKDNASCDERCRQAIGRGVWCSFIICFFNETGWIFTFYLEKKQFTKS